MGPASIYAHKESFRSNLRERAIIRGIGVKGAGLFPRRDSHARDILRRQTKAG